MSGSNGNGQSGKTTVSGLALYRQIVDCALDGDLKFTLIVFARYANADGVAWPAIATVGRLIGKSERTARRLVTVLVDAGVLVPCSRRVGGLRLSTRYFIDASALPANPDTGDRVSAPNPDMGDRVSDLPDHPPANPNPDMGDRVWAANPDTRDTETRTNPAPNPDTGVRGTVRTELLKENCTYDRTSECTERDQEQRRTKRAVTPDVAFTGSGWRTWESREAFEAELATVVIPGPFASPPMAQKLGFSIFDRYPLEPFSVHVHRLEEMIRGQRINTTTEQCRQAMADVHRARAMRDRTYDAGLDRDYRAGRQ